MANPIFPTQSVVEYETVSFERKRVRDRVASLKIQSKV